jgi:hypothetical protein
VRLGLLAMGLVGAVAASTSAPSTALAQTAGEPSGAGPLSSGPSPMPLASAWVYLDAPGFVLERWNYDGSGRLRWETVCSAPCNVNLPSGGFAYRVAADGYLRSSPFFLRASGGRTEQIDVEGASRAQLAVGVLMVSVGGLSLGVGLFFLPFAVLGGWFAQVALGFTGSGACLAGVGGILWSANQRTRVEQVLGPVEPSWIRPKVEEPSPAWSGAVHRWPLAPASTLFSVGFD